MSSFYNQFDRRENYNKLKHKSAITPIILRLYKFEYYCLFFMFIVIPISYNRKYWQLKHLMKELFEKYSIIINTKIVLS